MKKLAVSLIALSLAAACGKDDSSVGLDQGKLATFRKALPSESMLAAKKPQGSAQNAIGDPAMYPIEAGPIAIHINLAVVGMVNLMRAITDLEPTLYNSDTQEFLWGPWDNDNGFGTVAAYIKQQPEGADFRYVYALLRGVGNDLQTMKPVIWGGSNPDTTNPDFGNGITLWDFEANYEFAQANDPDFATQPYDRGRFVAIYAQGADENEPTATATWVYAVFRNFIGKDDYVASADPFVEGADLDYLYGRYLDTTGWNIDFLHFAFAMDAETSTPALEDVSVKMAFLNSGWGRAEASANGGDLVAPEAYNVTECWDAALDRTFLNQVATDSEGNPYTAAEGVETSCGPDVNGTPLFANTLSALGLPDLNDVDLGLKAALENAAENGLQ